MTGYFGGIMSNLFEHLNDANIEPQYIQSIYGEKSDLFSN